MAVKKNRGRTRQEQHQFLPGEDGRCLECGRERMSDVHKLKRYKAGEVHMHDVSSGKRRHIGWGDFVEFTLPSGAVIEAAVTEDGLMLRATSAGHTQLFIQPYVSNTIMITTEHNNYEEEDDG